MNVEDSYEGAVRRLQRLELAGVALESPQSHAVDEAAVDDNAERMRQLEELALLACEDNERLKREFGAALQELDDTRKELDGARAEIEELRGYIASLPPAAASTQANAPPQPFAAQPFAAPAEPLVTAPPAAESWPFPEPSPEEDFGYPPKSRGKGAFYFFVVAIIGAAVAALCVMRPWDRPHAPAMVVEPPAPPPPPVVTAPPPAPRVAPTIPTVAPTTPKVAPTIPTVAPTTPKVARAAAKPATKTRSAHKHARHHAAKKHSAATTKAIASDTSDDPLGGTGL